MVRSTLPAFAVLAVLAGCNQFDQEPRITGISPDSGPLAGGTGISISGSGFDKTSEVYVGGAPASNVAFNSTGAITASTPRGVALGAVDVTVKNKNGLSDTSKKGFTYSDSVSTVTVTGVSPSSGAGGVAVAIAGSNFQTGATVSFGGAAATGVTVASATQINCTTPAAGTGAVTVVVTNPDGTSGSLANGYTYPGTTTTPPTGNGKTISAYAGTGTIGGSGDGTQAAQAQLASPQGVALSSDGTVYVVDTGQNKVRQITSAGIISTFAGTGSAGFSGDNAAAGAATLNQPQGVAVDNQGVIYVADTGNHAIRAITAGTITTFAGKGTQSGNTGDAGLATDALLNAPRAVLVDGSRNVFIADTGNNRVRRVDFTQKKINAFAGNGTASFAGDGAAATAASFSAPSGLAIDSSGNLFIADSSNHRVRKVDAQGNVNTFAGGGTATADGGLANAVQLSNPTGICFDASNALVIAETGANKVRLVTTGNLTITTLAGTGSVGNTGDGTTGGALQATLSGPRGVVANGTTIFVCDAGNARVRQIK